MPGSESSEVTHDELDDSDLPEPDFDISGTYDAVDSDVDEDTVIKEDIPTAGGPDGSDETIMMVDDDDDDITR
jgi:hypothetical protein